MLLFCGVVVVCSFVGSVLLFGVVFFWLFVVVFGVVLFCGCVWWCFLRVLGVFV